MQATTNDIKITRTTSTKINEIDFANIKFGQFFSDHLFITDYKNGQWNNPRIEPFAELSISPACAAIHYGQSIFEGLKAFKTETGEVNLFRPQMNAKRINVSANRMCMPEVPEELFMEALSQLINLDRDWIPTAKGASLYIRPFMFASEKVLGVRPAEEYKFIIFSAPVASYYGEPVKIKIENHYTRAAEGGAGFTKNAGNYGASLYPAKLAKQEGFHQLVWTDAKEHKYIEESGTMNIFFQIDDKLITPSLDNKTTLAGITRDSIITLAKEANIVVEERRISVDEIIAAARNNKLHDAFGAGTAAAISQVKSLTYNDETFELPPIETREYSNAFSDTLTNIKRSIVPDKHGWIVRV